jgi:PAS domain S-box-containing protein
MLVHTLLSLLPQRPPILLPLQNPWWAALGYSCYVGGHLAQSILTAALAACFIFLCTVFALVFFDPSPVSANHMAKTSGRSDFLLLCVKTLMVVLVKTFGSYLGPWPCLVIVAGASVCFFSANLCLMPFYHHATNQLQLAFASVFASACVCALIGQGYPGWDAGVAFYVCAPLAAFCGVQAADWRAGALFRAPLSALWLATDVELKARYVIHHALHGHHTRHAGPAELRGAGEYGLASGGSIHDEEAGSGRKGGSKAKQALHEAADDSDEDTRAAVARSGLADDPAASAAVKAIFHFGGARFKRSALLQLLLSRYYAAFSGNKHLQMRALAAAERCNPAFDIAFAIFQARKRLEDGGGEGGGGSSSSAAGGDGKQPALSALARVAFDKHLADARRLLERALYTQAAFWSELLEPQGASLPKLQSLCGEHFTCVDRGEAAFKELLALNPQSLLVLRLLAEFTLRCKHDAGKAAAITAEADRMEEAAAREEAGEGGLGLSGPGGGLGHLRVFGTSALDVMSDNTGIITIGGTASNLGIILSANAPACKLFGLSRSDILRRNVSVLLPEPLASMHDSFMRRYLTTGESQLVDYTRVVLAKHKAGYVFPMLLAVRESPPSQGAPCFVGLLRPVMTVEQHILLDRSLCITAASQSSLAALGIDAAALAMGGAGEGDGSHSDDGYGDQAEENNAEEEESAAPGYASGRFGTQSRGHRTGRTGGGRGAHGALHGALNLRDWVPELDAVLPRLRAPGGVTLCIDAGHAQRMAQLRSAGEAKQSGGAAVPAAVALEAAHMHAADSPADNQTWVQAQLQEIVLPGSGAQLAVLYWRRLSSDRFTMTRAVARRRSSLRALAGEDATGAIGGASRTRSPGGKRMGLGALPMAGGAGAPVVANPLAAPASTAHSSATAAHTLAMAPQSHVAAMPAGPGFPVLRQPSTAAKPAVTATAAAASVPQPGNEAAVAALPAWHPHVTFGAGSETPASGGCPMLLLHPFGAPEGGLASVEGSSRYTPAVPAGITWVPAPVGADVGAAGAVGSTIVAVSTATATSSRIIGSPDAVGLPAIHAAGPQRALSAQGLDPVAAAGDGSGSSGAASQQELGADAVVELLPSAHADDGSSEMSGRFGAAEATATQQRSRDGGTPHRRRGGAATVSDRGAESGRHSGRGTGRPDLYMENIARLSIAGSHGQTSHSDGEGEARAASKRQGLETSGARSNGAIGLVSDGKMSQRYGYGVATDSSSRQAPALNKLPLQAFTATAGNKLARTGEGAPAPDVPGHRAGLETPDDADAEVEASESVASKGDRDGGGSVASSTLSISGTRLKARLQRALAEGRLRMLAPLWRLRLAAIAVSLIAFAVAVTVAVVDASLFSDYKDLLVHAALASRLLMSIDSVSARVRRVQLVNDGFVNVTAAERVQDAWWLAHSVEQFDALRSDIISYAYSIGRGDDFDGSFVPMTKYFADPLSGVLTRGISTVSLTEALLELQKAAYSIAAAPPASVHADSSDVLTVFAVCERGDGTREGLNATITQYARFQQAQTVKLGAVSVASYASAMALLLLLAVAVILPILCWVDRAKNEVLLLFTRLPKPVLLNLRATAEADARRLAQADDDAESGSDSESEDGMQALALMTQTEADVGSAVGGRGSRATRDGNSRASQEEGEDGAAVTVTEATAAGRPGKRGGGGGAVGFSIPSDQVAAAGAGAGASVAKRQTTLAAFTGRNRVAPSDAAAGVESVASGKQRSRGGNSSKRRAAAATHAGNMASATTCAGVSRLSVVFLLPLLLSALFFSVLFTVRQVTLSRAAALSATVFAVNSRNVHVWDIPTQTRIAMLMPSTYYGYSLEDYARSLSAGARQTLADVQYKQRLVNCGGVPADPLLAPAARQGGVDTSLLTSDADQQLVSTLLAGSVCDSPEMQLDLSSYSTSVLAAYINETAANGYVPTAATRAAWRAECAAMRGGLLLKGADGALVDAISLAEGLLFRRDAATVNEGGTGTMRVNVTGFDGSVVSSYNVPYSWKAELNSQAYTQFRPLVHQYLIGAYTIVSGVFERASTSNVDTFLLFEECFVGIFIPAFALMILAWYLPRVAAQNQHILKQRTMLMYLPPGAIKASPQLARLVQEIIAASGPIGASRSSGGPGGSSSRSRRSSGSGSVA